ncbi:modulator of FtsH protease [Ectothiorhodosinus mongolicus]|uniref:Modulator of FtsH protease n=1 Tax=Ectothiorhodosinus mongolicus TaxID=233100 RepID=A0A1R3VMZ1_9GAMM|nr:Bax inhibitor-1/YccA family protein [Ectothiorhodosinus mongolicus]ULX56420.1 BAX inhibitor (BI)-1/YccA family protein [Ectothiorhodosinus mongolicus]SIT65948.1 modulator of FtsH protease [Ectothiorhodosinus mongolicus]
MEARSADTLSRSQAGARTLATNKVIRNTYLLLSMNLAFSAMVAFVAMATGAKPVSWILMIAVFLGMPFAIHALRNSIWGLPATFVFTGVMGYILGPIVGFYLGMANGPAIVGGALATTAVAFVGLSGYALATRKDFSFLGGFVLVGFLVILAAIVANLFLAIPALSLAISSAAVMLVSAAILWDTSRMVHDGEANYITMTVSLFANIYVLFLHLMNLFAAFTGDN